MMDKFPTHEEKTRKIYIKKKKRDTGETRNLLVLDAAPRVHEIRSRQGVVIHVLQPHFPLFFKQSSAPRDRYAHLLVDRMGIGGKKKKERKRKEKKNEHTREAQRAQSGGDRNVSRLLSFCFVSFSLSNPVTRFVHFAKKHCRRRYFIVRDNCFPFFNIQIDKTCRDSERRLLRRFYVVET